MQWQYYPAVGSILSLNFSHTDLPLHIQLLQCLLSILLVSVVYYVRHCITCMRGHPVMCFVFNYS